MLKVHDQAFSLPCSLFWRSSYHSHPHLHHHRRCQKIITSELLQLGIAASACMSNGLLADPSLDTSAIASATFLAATASYRHFSRANDISFHAI
ncbi:hypothetical protein REPUB_Repub02eG0289800 [Reevesia pubescens]